MPTNITLRSEKGSGLTNAEIDANFAALKVTADAAGLGGGGAFAGITGAPTDNAALSAALAGKAPTGHVHPFSILTGQPTDNAALSLALSYKADSTATAAALAGKADATATSAALAGKSDVGHGHSIVSITNLQATLDNKQVALVSASNIKTVNGASLLGVGDLVVTGAGGAPVQRTAAQLAAAPLAGDIALGATATFQDSVNPALRYVMNAAQTAFVAIAGGGAAAQNSLAPASTTLAPSVDAVNAGLSLKADYLAPGIITAATTLIRSPVSPATNGFNRVQYCSVTVATTVTATGAQALVGDYIVLDNSNPASTAIVTLAGVTARAGYTLDAAAGSTVEALCVAAGSFQANTLIPVVAGATAAKVSFMDQTSFIATPNLSRDGTPGLNVALYPQGIEIAVFGTNVSRTKTAGLRGSLPVSGYDGPNTANSDVGIYSNGRIYIFDERPAFVRIGFAVADSLGLGCVTAVGFSWGGNADPATASEQSKIMIGSQNTDAEFFVWGNDSVTNYPTKIASVGGAGFPCNDPTVPYEYTIAYFPTGPRRFVWTLKNMLTAVTATGTITTAAQMPSKLDPVQLTIRRNSKAIVGIAKIDVFGIASGFYA